MAKIIASNDISNVESEYTAKSDVEMNIQVDLRYLSNITKFIGENSITLKVNVAMTLVLVKNLE